MFQNMIYFLHMLNFLPNGTFTDSFLEFERIFLYSFFLHDWGLQMASWSPEIPDLGPRSRVAPGFRAAPGSLPGLGLRSRVAPGFGPPLPGRSRVAPGFWASLPGRSRLWGFHLGSILGLGPESWTLLAFWIFLVSWLQS